MASGKVKWWDRRKGYGFIIGEAGGDVFVHYSTIQGSGYKSLEPGEVVRYELIQSSKGMKAEKVERGSRPRI
jgi:CspA family cold shock protein